MRVGIGVTTRNRSDLLPVALENIRRFLPDEAKLVVVDDFSDEPVPQADYRFHRNVGIAVAKNKCLELLDDCEHIFLFDDDCWPKADNWHVPYIESPEPHLMYVFREYAVGSKKLGDIAQVYSDDQLVAYSHTRGCMLYLHRSCLETIGGFDPVFGKWGSEHGNYSERVFAAGLTLFPYMDVVGSDKLIYSADEHRAVATTVPKEERKRYVEKNRKLSSQRTGTPYYVPYKAVTGTQDTVLTCYFTGTPDWQRGEKWEADESALEILIASLRHNGVAYTVLNDCFPDKEGFVRTPAMPGLSASWQRWVAYLRYLRDNPQIDRVWLVDATDVEMLRNPFPAMEPGIVYVGTEQSQLTRCRWMRANHGHRYMDELYQKHGNDTLRNAGLLGGSRADVMEFVRGMLRVLQKNRADVLKNQDYAITGSDMGAFNYVSQLKFGPRVQCGPHVNTVFKEYRDNGSAWWRHK